MSENPNKDFNLSKFLLDILVDTVIVAVLVVIIRLFLFAPFQVHGQSMCNTFNDYDGECISGDGEYVLTSRLSTWNLFGWSPSTIERGDIIIFKAPYSEDGDFYIKRVIGLPGDQVKVEDGLVSVLDEDGVYIELDEPYLSEENQGNTQAFHTSSEVFSVPDGAYFVLGDNRTRSNDSRRCFQQTGCTAKTSPYLIEDFIEGEVKMVLFPLSHVRFVKDFDYSV
ncbi:MAG: signal peptidase I [Candidatus Gracilibacteria bacterium]|jgi:signal peptidase I